MELFNVLFTETLMLRRSIYRFCLLVFMAAIGAPTAFSDEYRPIGHLHAKVEKVSKVPSWYRGEEEKNKKRIKSWDYGVAVSQDGGIVAEIDASMWLRRGVDSTEKQRIVSFDEVEEGADLSFFNNATDISISPDGRKIIFMAIRNMSESMPYLMGHIYLYDIAAKRLDLLIRDVAVNYVGYSSAAWSPDSEAVIFVGSESIYLYETDRRRLSRIVSTCKDELFAMYDLIWRPGGRELVYKVKNLITDKFVGYYSVYGF